MRQAALAALIAALVPALAGVAAGAQAPEPELIYDYAVQRGDTLIGLSRRLLVEPQRWSELAQLNRLPDANRLRPGQQLQIPLRLMRTEAVPAGVLSVRGTAQGAGAALRDGQTLAEGAEVSTGADGHVTLRLVDGTVLRLRPDSQLQLNTSRRVPQADLVRSGAVLQRGRVEVEAAPAPAGKPGFRIETPQGALAVRGTEFRVASDAQAGLTRGEVLGGAVRFDAAAAPTPQRVEAGFGAVIDATAVAPPVRLLPRPDLSALPPLQERLLLRFVLQPLEGAVAYRAQLSRDARFDQVVADTVVRGTELRFADLPDGSYVLRVRGIDAQGLEGADADWRFLLKAQPEPPLPTTPPPRTVGSGTVMSFAWAENAQAQRYRLQVATDATFTRPLHELNDVTQPRAVLQGLEPGVYYWRVASVRGQGDALEIGPWGDAQRFELRAQPLPPSPPQLTESGLSFAWEGRPGQSYEFQIARDAAFTQLLLSRWIDVPALVWAPDEAGSAWVRLRARDADGFVGPYSTAQKVELPACLSDGSGRCVRDAGGATWKLQKF